MVVRQRGSGSLMFAADGETREVAVAAARELVRLDENTSSSRTRNPPTRTSAPSPTTSGSTTSTITTGRGSTRTWRRTHSRVRGVLEIGVYHRLSPTWMGLLRRRDVLARGPQAT